MMLFTCRANPILADFIRQVYWNMYGAGYSYISNDDARDFVVRSIDDGKTHKHWSENMIRRVSAYLTGCCADYGLLEKGTRSNRKILPFRITAPVAAYLAYDPSSIYIVPRTFVSKWAITQSCPMPTGSYTA